VLAQTTSCDEGVQFDLNCDACGAHFAARDPLRRDPATLVAAAGQEGWVVLSGVGGYGHRCESCVPGARMVAARRVRHG
jgi:hypothetical protein